MRLFPLLLLLGVWMTWTAACAETNACHEGQALVDEECVTPGPSPSREISVGCRNSINDTTSVLAWELTVDPVTIRGGEQFTAALDGVVIFDEAFLDAAQTTELGAVDEVEILDLTATVRVRSGAVGPDVTLRLDNIQYKCAQPPRATCDPGNDLTDGGNSDCLPMDDSNRCGHFVALPISTDCAPEGICARLEKSFQCESVGLCVTGPLDLPLARDFGRYTADSEGTVVFGWVDDPGPLATKPVFIDEIGGVGMRARIGPFPLAFECAMPPSTPASALVSFPIETP